MVFSFHKQPLKSLRVALRTSSCVRFEREAGERVGVRGQARARARRERCGPATQIG